jgi:NodT family efflux transporter outer membrane factor (OMF) lipoprotein
MKRVRKPSTGHDLLADRPMKTLDLSHQPSRRRQGTVALRAAAAIAALSLVAGCAGFSPESTRAQARDAASLLSERTLGEQSQDPAAWLQEDWWTRFGDAQLNALITEALSDNPSMRVAEARLRQAQALQDVAMAAQSPQVNAAAKSMRQRFSEHSTVPKPLAGSWQLFNEATVSVGYELDFWGRNRAAVEAAVGRTRAAEVDRFAARLLLSTTVARSYLRLQHVYEQMDIAQATLRQREQILALTEKRMAAGLDSAWEQQQAQAALPPARQQILAIEEALALTRAQIAAQLGKGPDRGLAVARPQAHADAPVALPSVLPADLLGRRPDVVAQKWRVQAAAGDVSVARAQFYPNISLVALAGVQSLGLSSFPSAGSAIAGIGPAVSLPIFDGGRLRGNLALRQAEYDTAVEQYNQTLVDALHDVVQQVTSLRSLSAQRQEQAQATATARRAYELALARYRDGVGNYLQVLTAQTQLLSQQALEAELQARQLDLTVNLMRALGGGYDASPATAALAR